MACSGSQCDNEWSNYFNGSGRNHIYNFIQMTIGLTVIKLLVRFLAWVLEILSIFNHYFYKIDEETDKHGGHLVARVLAAHGIKQIFTFPGVSISPILMAAQELNIRMIDTRLQETAVFAADAASRLSGLPGVAVINGRPDLTNTVTPMENALIYESPMVVITSFISPDSPLTNSNYSSDINYMKLMKSCTKWRKRVTKARDIVPSLREAFRKAQSDMPGPVFIEISRELLFPREQFRRNITRYKTKTWYMKCFVWYSNHYWKNLYAGAFNERCVYRPLPIKIATPKESEIRRAAQMIYQARRPLILLDSQVYLPTFDTEQLAACVQCLGIPCFLYGMSRGLLGRKNPLHLVHGIGEAIKKSDCVILAGTTMNADHRRKLSSGSKIIAINRSKSQLGKNKNQLIKVDSSINADVSKSILHLQEKLGHVEVDSGWLEELRQINDGVKARIAKKMETPVDRHLNPIKVLSKLEDCLPDNTIIVTDGGIFVQHASYILHPYSSLQWFSFNYLSALGCGGGFALGAKAVRPDANVVIIFGDGALGLSLIEFDSFVRNNLPVMSVVGNDACLSRLERQQMKLFGSTVACNYSNYVEFDRAAESLGAIGFKLDASNETELETIFRHGLDLTKKGKSVLINALIGKADFFESSN